MQRTVTAAILFIMSGSVLLTSGYFYDELNDVKRWSVVVGSLLLLVVCSLMPKGFSSLFRAVRSSLFCVGMSVIGTVLSVQGVLQYLHVLASHNAYFHVTGSYENPAGFAVAVCVMFPFAVHLLSRRPSHLWQRLFGAVAAMVMVVAVVLSQSRSGILALCVSIGVMLTGVSEVRRWVLKYRYQVLAAVVLLVPCVLFGLYCMKPDSADGRLFIWRVCLDMIRESPLTGYGPSGFLTHYMPAQADYFSSHPDSQYMLLSDNITHPFNEYLKLTVKYGMVGLLASLLLLVMWIRGVWINGGKYRHVALSVMSVLFILCQFSYPFNYAISWFVAALSLLYASPESVFAWFSHRIRRSLLSAGFMTLLSYSFYNMYHELKWAAISRRSLAGYTEQMIPHYELMLPHMKDNHLFLYNYAADLNYIGSYDESMRLTKACTHLCLDYDVQMLLADNLEQTGRTDDAVAAYSIASLMIPNRLVPLESIMDIYLSLADTVRADSVAWVILGKRVKVPSAAVEQIMRDAREWLDGGGHEKSEGGTGEGGPIQS